MKTVANEMERILLRKTVKMQFTKTVEMEVKKTQAR